MERIASPFNSIKPGSHNAELIRDLITSRESTEKIRRELELTNHELETRIGQTLNIKAIAEFVENNEILEALRDIGVDSAQGYGIAMPVPLEEALYGANHKSVLKLVASR